MELRTRGSANARIRRGVVTLLASCIAITAIVGLNPPADALGVLADSAGVDANLIGTDNLDPPTLLAAVDTTPGQIDLSWVATVDTYATGYQVYRSETQGSGYSLLDSVAGNTTIAYSDTSFVGAVFSSFQSTLQSTAVTSVVVSVPAGVVSGDLLLAHIVTDGNSPTFATPTGWTHLLSNPGGSGSGFAVYYRVADGTEPADYTFTWTNSGDAVGVIIGYTGVDTAAPINVSALSTGSSTSPTAPAVTTTVADAYVIRLVGTDNGVAITAPSGNDSRYALQTTGGTDTSAGNADITQATAGSTGTAAFSLGTSEAWSTASIALTPAATTYYYVIESFFGNWTSTFSNETSGSAI